MTKKKVLSFEEISVTELDYAGGKGGTLAKLYQSGFPVPPGFVILPYAFSGEELSNDVWEEILSHLKQFNMGKKGAAFAVRSSALGEDSAQASFAGEFETVLDVRTEKEIYDAIHVVQRSRESERVQAYSQAKGLDFSHDIAVVIQELIPAEISGVLFTADPVTGSRHVMSGNYVRGFGDALVSGEVDAIEFEFRRPKGEYEGPEELKKYAKKLYTLGNRLEQELSCPQDIEWSVAGGKLYLLQSRPITTLMDHNPVTQEWNSSYGSDYLWVAIEIFPDVILPSSWSVWQNFQQFNISGISGMGNIGGRVYSNYSFAYSMLRAMGRSDEETKEFLELGVGIVPEKVTLPLVPLTRWQLYKSILPMVKELLPLQIKLKKREAEILAESPARCEGLRREIREVKEGERLSQIWREEILPTFINFLQLQDMANEGYFYPYIAIRNEIKELVGEERANEILTAMVDGSATLTSLGSIVGLVKLANGEMTREEYLQLVGHRMVLENDISLPRPYEDPDWIDRKLSEFEESPIDPQTMVTKSSRQFEKVWGTFESQYPRKARKLYKKLQGVITAMKKREVVRSELTRYMGSVREWYLKAGELLDLGDDIFYLRVEEVIEVLAGDLHVLEHISARCELYDRLKTLPQFPQIISGRFDPFRWAQDPDRRSDVFDSNHKVQPVESGTIITGRPGSAGHVEGLVRRIDKPEQGDQLKSGEILVTSTTNIGWTPVFPKAAAVVTDIGAPLSHAAIVARELGIPAVVGCGTATLRLETGTRVVVDGSKGVVEILQK
jgi:pyruvate,water dikinase